MTHPDGNRNLLPKGILLRFLAKIDNHAKPPPPVEPGRRHRHFFLCLVLTAAVIPACGREAMAPALPTAIARSSGAFPFKDKRVFVLENRWGRIHLQSQMDLQGRILWQIDKSVAATNPRLADETLDKIRLSFSTRRDTIFAVLTVIGATGTAAITAALRLQLPPALECLILPTLAPATAVNLRMPLRFLAPGDSVLVIGHHSDLFVETGNAAVEAQVTLSPMGTCSLSLTRGDISLRVPVSTQASIHLAAPNGMIHYQNLSLTVIDQTPGRLVAVLGNANATIDLRTGDGDIVLSGEESPAMHIAGWRDESAGR